jgi:hypothetical protein
MSSSNRSGLKIGLMVTAIAIIALIVASGLFSGKTRRSLLDRVSPESRASARLDTCKSNMRHMAFLMLDYLSEHSDHFPTHAGGDWILEVYPYIAKPRELYCPNDSRGLAALNQAEETVKGSDRDQIRRGVETLAVLDQLRKNQQPLTDYWLPPAVAGKKWDDLLNEAVILEEHGPGHEGKWLRIHKDFSFTLAPAEK